MAADPMTPRSPAEEDGGMPGAPAMPGWGGIGMGGACAWGRCCACICCCDNREERKAHTVDSLTETNTLFF